MHFVTIAGTTYRLPSQAEDACAAMAAELLSCVRVYRSPSRNPTHPKVVATVDVLWRISAIGEEIQRRLELLGLSTTSEPIAGLDVLWATLDVCELDLAGSKPSGRWDTQQLLGLLSADDFAQLGAVAQIARIRASALTGPPARRWRPRTRATSAAQEALLSCWAALPVASRPIASAAIDELVAAAEGPMHPATARTLLALRGLRLRRGRRGSPIGPAREALAGLASVPLDERPTRSEFRARWEISRQAVSQLERRTGVALRRAQRTLEQRRRSLRAQLERIEAAQAIN